MSRTIKRLDLTNLRLTLLPTDLMTSLTSLQHLDLSFNDLCEESFEAPFAKLRTLVELTVHYNRIGAIPRPWRSLRGLTRLKIGNNQLKSIEGVDKLKKLQILIVENNEVETLDKSFYTSLTRLEILHFGNNLLRNVAPDIRNMRFLRHVDVSHNNLTTLRAELFQLPRIEVLNASANQISRIPTIATKGKAKHPISDIDLSDNLLVKFPDHLLMIADSVDLTHNRIKVSVSAKYSLPENMP